MSAKHTLWEMQIIEGETFIFRFKPNGSVEHIENDELLRRINAHDGLVEALKESIKQLEYLHELGDFDNQHQEWESKKSIHELKEALAAVEVKS